MESRAARLTRDDANQSLERSHAEPPSGTAGLRADAASLSSHVRLKTMKHLKIQCGTGGWELGDNIAFHFLEVDQAGVVQRVIDLNHQGDVVDAAPSERNPYGAVDHAPLSVESDWSEDQISQEEFESVWAKAQT